MTILFPQWLIDKVSDAAIASAVGGAVGFALAQVKSLHEFLVKPRLVIEDTGMGFMLFAEPDEIVQGELLEVRKYGFRIKNKGRRAARGVKPYLVKADVENRGNMTLTTVSHISQLGWEAMKPPASLEGILLIPGATAEVLLAHTREDVDALYPVIDHDLPMYEEACSRAVAYTFHVAAVAETGETAEKIIRIKLGQYP